MPSLRANFSPLLLACLGECARGRWGLFGQHDHLDPERRYCAWPEAKRLKSLAREIGSIRLELGQVTELSERFLQLCSSRGANVPGEPRLASEFRKRYERHIPSEQTSHTANHHEKIRNRHGSSLFCHNPCASQAIEMPAVICSKISCCAATFEQITSSAARRRTLNSR